MTWHFDAEYTEAAATESSWTTDDGLRFALSAAAGVRHPVGFDPDLTSENSADTPSEISPTFRIVIASGDRTRLELG
jgi:hypothetical protein